MKDSLAWVKRKADEIGGKVRDSARLKSYAAAAVRRWQEIPRGILIGTGLAFVAPTTVRLLAELTRWLRSTVSGAPELGNFLTILRGSGRLPENAGWLLGILVVAALGLSYKSLGRFFRRSFWGLILKGTSVWAVVTLACLLIGSPEAYLIGAASALLITGASYHLESVRAGPISQRSPDEPIESSREDELNRQSLVDTVTRRILWESTSVVALVGPYGEGKTSILNLLNNSLKKENVVVVHFKTWLPGDEPTLVSSLFTSISEGLGQHFFAGRLRGVLRRYARVVSGLIPRAPSGLRDLFQDLSQQDQIGELKAALARLPVRRAVVLLDEMDRMHAEELKTLLKIIRASGEYQKLTFVCAFHKEALAQILSGWESSQHVNLQFTSEQPPIAKASIQGQVLPNYAAPVYEYLEKFFPVQIPVPKMDDAMLQKQFSKRFSNFCSSNALLQTSDEKTGFDKQFDQTWNSHFKHALNNIRKLNSYFNALSWSFPGVKKEVNLLDFMLLELLRQAEPAVYEQVYKNRKYLYYPEWEIERWTERIVGEERDKTERSEAYGQVVRGLYGERRTFVLDLLSTLFPRFQDYWKGRGLGLGGKPDESEAEKERRIFHPAFFPVYFTFQVPAGYFGGEELDAFIAEINARGTVALATEFFQDYFQRLQDLKRYRFLDRVILFQNQLNEIAAEGAALGIAELADGLEEGFLEIGEYGAARRLVFVVAARFEKSERIMDVLLAVLRNSTSDRFALDIFVFCKNRERNNIIQDWGHVDVGQLEDAFVKRMRSRFYPGTVHSAYQGAARDFTALFMWSRCEPNGLKDVQDYLRFEFGARPASIGKHILWLWPGIRTDENQKTAADRFFPFKELAALIEAKGSAVWTTDAERKALTEFLQFISSQGSGAEPRANLQ